MKPLFIADADDALGFAVAGFATAACATREEVDAAVANAAKDDVLVFSAATAALISDRIGEWRHAATGPMFVVLPGRVEVTRRER